MARRATISKLLEGGPFTCRMVNPDQDVVVLELLEGGARAEVQAFGRTLTTLVKVGGLRATLPKKTSEVATWVRGELDGGDRTYAQLVDDAPERLVLGIAPTLANMSKRGTIVEVGVQRFEVAGKRPKHYRIWSLRKKVEA